MTTETTTDLILRKTTGGDWRPLIKHFDPLTGEERVLWAGPVCGTVAGAFESLNQKLKRPAEKGASDE